MATAILKSEELFVSYGTGARKIIDGLTVEFQRNKFTALIGPNGCGKSTLLKAIMGFLPAMEGKVELDGRSIDSYKRKELARRVAFLPQENHCPDYLTLGELVELGGYSRFSLFGGPSKQDKQHITEILETVGLVGLENVQVNSLSGGQRQRAWIAMVLAQNSDIILFDEPVNHLDLKYQYAILDLIRTLTSERGKTVVAVLHDLNLATAYADDIAMLKDGKLVTSGPVRQAMTTSMVKTVFDLDIDILENSGRLICLPHSEAAPRQSCEA